MKILKTVNIYRLDTKNYTLKDIYDEVTECQEILKYFGYNPGEVVDIKWNTRAKKRLGNCHREYGVFSLNFNKLYFEIGEPINIHSTIMHEIIHTIPNCFNHGPNFQKVANVLNGHFNYKIARTSSDINYSSFLQNEREKRGIAYLIHCNTCGKDLKHYYRTTKIIKSIKNNEKRYMCPFCRSTNLSIISGKEF